MAKIPFEATFTAAYQFLFRRMLSIIGTLWLPQLLCVALFAGIAYLVVPHTWWQGQLPVLDAKNPDPAAFVMVTRTFFVILWPMMVLGLVFTAMMCVGLQRLALEQSERCFVFFSLGGDVWRLVAAWMLSYLFMMVIFVLVVLAATTIGAVGQPLIGGWGIFLAVLCGIAGVCFFLYVGVRLVFFLPAVVAAEHKLGLERSWNLGRGNFWRIVGLCLVTVLPVMIVGWILQQIVVATPAGADYARWMHDYYTHLLSQPANVDIGAQIIGQLRAMWPIMPWLMLIGFLQNIALYGLVSGATAKAYLAVRGSGEAHT